jgi:hypothetical protein
MLLCLLTFDERHAVGHLSRPLVSTNGDAHIKTCECLLEPRIKAVFSELTTADLASQEVLVFCWK